MYYDYFGLKQPPFKITPDTSLFYPGGDRGAVLEALIYATMNGEGIVKVVGEVGSGKTMLCRMLELELPESVEIVYLGNPSLSPDHILHAIAIELKLPVTADSPRLQVMNEIHACLLQRHADGRQVVVFVEEAQSMPLPTLEEIRFLSNLETRQHKLLQIVLFGQPELDQMISRPEIRQLKERITYNFHLKPFKQQDVTDYISVRLRSCGQRSGELFSPAAVKTISRYSQGLIRRINILADKSMLAAYADGRSRVEARHVRQAARDSDFLQRKRSPLSFAMVGTAILFVIALTFIMVTDLRGGLVVVLERFELPSLTSAGAQQQNTDSDSQGAGQTRASAGDQAYIQDQMVIEPSPDYEENEGTDAAMPESEPVISLKPPASDNGAAPVEADGEDLLNSTEVISVSGLTEHDERALERQIQYLPPEEAYMTGSTPKAYRCENCWSIIYRPMINPENL